MGSDSDLHVSLPDPPPPRPAARREAIDAALRRFDGLPDAPPQPRPRRQPWWSTMHRRPAGALVTVAIVALISIPAIQIALRDGPASEIGESREPAVPRPATDSADRAVLPVEAPQSPEADRAADAGRSPAATPPARAGASSGFTADSAEQEVAAEPATPFMMAPAPPMAAAPPPPPPPPPRPPEPQAEEADDSGNIVVTGSRVRRPNLESASPIAIIQHQGDFLSRLRDALADNDRRAVVEMVGLPLRVNFATGSRTYSSSRDVARDYDRIFTPAVRASVLDAGRDEVQGRDGGRLRGIGRIWFGCGKRSCPADSTIRVREVTP